MELSDILQLGDPRLYEQCAPIQYNELPTLQPIVDDLAGLILKFRAQYGAGRAIAAPQVGIMKRLVVLNIDHPIALINPLIFEKSSELFELWDDCMSFPHLLVRLKRHSQCKIKFKNLNWEDQEWFLEGDLSELLQHECDHLDGVLATMRAIDKQSFKWR